MVALQTSQATHTLKQVDELTPDQLKQLQHDWANTWQLPIFFQDKLKDQTAGPHLSLIPPGRFDMGSTARELGHRREEAPQHLVSLQQAFAIGRYPITAHEFERFCAATEWQRRPDIIWHAGDYPVINIRMADVKLYLQWLSTETGHIYRLPTEAEWEYAARAGTNAPFHFGDTIDREQVLFDSNFPYQEAQEKRLWFLPRSIPSRQAEAVGLRVANTWGLHDVHGNVWEFTSSHWTSSHLGANRDGSPSQHADPHWYVTKGGSWFDPATAARSASRKKRYFDEMDVNLGFRILRELDEVTFE